MRKRRIPAAGLRKQAGPTAQDPALRGRFRTIHSNQRFNALVHYAELYAQAHPDDYYALDLARKFREDPLHVGRSLSPAFIEWVSQNFGTSDGTDITEFLPATGSTQFLENSVACSKRQWEIIHNLEGGPTPPPPPPGPTPDPHEYFTATMPSGGNLIWKLWPGKDMQYSYDKITWSPVTDGALITAGAGNSVYFKGTNPSGLVDEDEWEGCHLTADAGYKVSGNILSLIYGDSYEGATSMPDYSFQELFMGGYVPVVWDQIPNPNLLDASELALPDFTSQWCYSLMFASCISLVAAPYLPATSISVGCYSSMYQNCSALTSVSKTYLPATSLADFCYSLMFQGCSALGSAPDLPATFVPTEAYNGMFQGCTVLHNPPIILGTQMGESIEGNDAGACAYMFYGSGLTSLPTLHFTEVPEWGFREMFEGTSINSIPATFVVPDIADHSCYGMFRDCVNLTSVHSGLLPDLTAEPFCYANMFEGCSSLQNAPALPATTLVTNPVSGNCACYQEMFKGCTALVTAPVLPATNIQGSQFCYKQMFVDCISLTAAPDLPAPTIPNEGYVEMFRGCSSLTSIKVYATDITFGPNTTGDWMLNVSPTGVFHCKPGVWPSTPDTSHVPYMWTLTPDL